MRKKNWKIQYNDLIYFKKKYNKAVNHFLSSNPETRVVFLDADFGWGKTKFVEDILRVNKQYIYSPWLNDSNNLIEDIYFNVYNKDKAKKNKLALLISLLIALFPIAFSTIINLIEIYAKNDSYLFGFYKDIKLVFVEQNMSSNLLPGVIIFFCLVFLGIVICISNSAIPIIDFHKNVSSEKYEKEIIKKIVKKIDDVLVIEDIDRVDDIESVLIVANKISEYIKENNLKKYILLTGDYIRMINRINNSTDYSSSDLNLDTHKSKGFYLVERIISLRINFSPIKDRIMTLLREYNLKNNLSKIEMDELVFFIKEKQLSIRYFIRFLDAIKNKKAYKTSLFFLLLNYYKEDKLFNYDRMVIENSICNLKQFPTCLNDIEILFEKKELKICNDIWNCENFVEKKTGNKELILREIKKVFVNKQESALICFKKYYVNNKYPRLAEDLSVGPNDKKIDIGRTLKPYDLKRDLDNFLIGYNVTNVGAYSINNKRCYFAINSFDEINNKYIIKEKDLDETETVSNDDFIIAYIASFFRENKLEIQANYPKINEKINQLIS